MTHSRLHLTGPDVLVCVDPGKTCGVAWLELGGSGPISVLDADSTTLADVLDGIQTGDLAETAGLATLVMEDTRALPIYARHRKGSVAAQLKKARNVGTIDLACDLIETYAEAARVPLVCVEPRGKKWDAETCRRITGYAGRTNQHSRDAIRAGWTVGPAHVREARAAILSHLAPTP